MRRGDLITVVIPGDYGKPRPALVVQNDAVADIDSIVVCLLTGSDEGSSALRFAVDPSDLTGLKEQSAVMVEKVTVARKDKCGRVIGRLTSREMDEIDTRLAFILGLAR